MSRKTRKLIWSAPLVAVLAVVGALALFVALSPNGAQADHVDLPGIVLDVTATADGRDTIDVKWKAPTDGGAVEHYRIDRSEDGGDNWMRLVQMHTDGLSYTDMMGLEPGEDYEYRVFGVNAAGTGPSSDLSAHSMATTDSAERPGPVRTLTGTAMGPKQINLAWYPPEDNGGSNITRYCISTTAGGTLPVPDTADPPAFSGENACLHNTPPTGNAAVSGVSQGLTALRAANSAGVIVIRAPEGDGKVEFMHTKLPASQERTYEVYAVNEQGISTTATAVAPAPETKAPGKPGKPTLRVVADNTANQVDLFWTWPADNGGADIVSFDVQSKTGSADYAALTASPVPVSAIRDTPDDPELADQSVTGAMTSFQVRANNGSKTSDWSNVVVIRANADGSVLSTTAPDQVTGLTASDDTSVRQIDLKWTDVAATSFLIDVSDDGGSTWTSLQGNTGYTDATYNHRGLDPDTDDTDDTDDYTYRVFSFMSGAYGPIMTMVGSTSEAAKPASVRGLKTSSDDPTMIKLEWAKPTVDGGQPITGYRVEIGLDATWPTTTATTAVTHMSEKCPEITGVNRVDYVCVREVEGADATMFTLGGLDAGTDRWFRVFAINKVFSDDSTAPDADDVRTADPEKGTSAKSGTPGMPLDLTVQPARDANPIDNEADPAELGIDILWNAPDDPAGDSVTAYEIARRTKDSTDAAWSAWDDDWASISNEGSDFLRTSYTDTDEPDNLANGEMREYRVTAKSGAGSGPTTASVVYPADTSHAAVPPVLGTPMNVDPRVVTVGGIKTISVLWESGDGEERQIVQLLTEDRMFVDSQTVRADAETADFDNDGEGVVPGTYRVQVVALGTGTDFRNSGTVLVTVTE